MQIVLAFGFRFFWIHSPFFPLLLRHSLQPVFYPNFELSFILVFFVPSSFGCIYSNQSVTLWASCHSNKIPKATNLQREKDCFGHCLGFPGHDRVALLCWASGEAALRSGSVWHSKLLSSCARRRKRLWSHNPLWGHIPSDLRPPTRPHFLKVPIASPNSTTLVTAL
jgi:hypothetical protein